MEPSKWHVASHSEVIPDKYNADIERIRRLRERAERERTGLFWTEGTRFVIQAAEQRAKIETLIVASEMPLPLSGRKVLQALCDIMVRIPMAGRSDSLNLAVATGVMLYEVFRRRHGVRRVRDHRSKT